MTSNRCLTGVTFDTGFRRFRVQRFGPRQCRQDFGGIAGQQGRDGQLEAREDAAVQHVLRVRQLRTVVVLFQAETFQAGFGYQPV